MATATKSRVKKKFAGKTPMSPAAQRAEDAKGDDSGPKLPALLPQFGPNEVLEIAPITTYNNWVVLIPFTMESALLLPATTDYRNIGIVVGKSNSMLTPNGVRVPSALEYGQVVLFQKKSVVAEMAISSHPYAGRKLIILSEVNIVCELPAVPHKLLEKRIGAEDFPQLQPDMVNQNNGQMR